GKYWIFQDTHFGRFDSSGKTRECGVHCETRATVPDSKCYVPSGFIGTRKSHSARYPTHYVEGRRAIRFGCHQSGTGTHRLAIEAAWILFLRTRLSSGGSG